jgi:hypothetical protein
MNINKAIRKQEKSHKRFLLIFGFIFLLLPLILILFDKVNLFFLIYLGIIETLILVAILFSFSSNYLKYSIEEYKIRLKFKRFGQGINIICDKVVLVHVEGTGQQMDVVLITNSKFRNKKVNLVDEVFLKKHPYISHYYYRIKKLNPEDNYFYIIISKGGYHKYSLLDLIYRNCVKSEYTEEAVERIKEYRK